MWFKTIFRPKTNTATATERPLFDEAFLRRMERLSLQAQRTLRGNPASGEHLSRHQLPASILSDHRPYSHGDDLRYVDWNAYARHDHVLLRLGEAEQDVHVHLLLDVSRSMVVGAPSRLRLAQQLVAALGYLALAHSDRLLIVPFGDRPLPAFGPAQGKARSIEMLRFIEALEPQPQTDLVALVRAHGRTYPHGGLVVLCSDLLDPHGLAEVLRTLSPPRWQPLVLHLLDRHDLQPDLHGALELEDSESGQRMELVLDAETLAAYQRGLRAWQAELADTCTRRGAIYAPILSDWPLEQQVVPYLRLRRLLT
ncbi:DUF58 domain-containing protein [Candidatus Oscillochloris fontis]|uniref:DUF58 domain-containing protein n=1 Tax=Candidatus Oscillochloris fontis TaxID=2496868 RepID=UPI00101E1042|nr:DUF58 domain-containing protein [Candidatus Oscillochloris fontis]